MRFEINYHRISFFKEVVCQSFVAVGKWTLIVIEKHVNAVLMEAIAPFHTHHFGKQISVEHKTQICRSNCRKFAGLEKRQEVPLFVINRNFTH